MSKRREENTIDVPCCGWQMMDELDFDKFTAFIEVDYCEAFDIINHERFWLNCWLAASVIENNGLL